MLHSRMRSRFYSPSDGGSPIPREPDETLGLREKGAPSANGGASRPNNGAGRGQVTGRDSALALFEEMEREERGEANGRPDNQNLNGLPGVTREREREGQGASHGAIEVADDASIRDFYGHLVTLLTQDNSPRPPAPKGRAGLKEALRRRFWPALLVFLVCFGVLANALRPRQTLYVGTAQLLLPARVPVAASDPLASPDDAYDAAAQIAIIGSEPIVKAALQRVPSSVKAKGFGDPHADSAPVDVSSGASEDVVNVSVSSLDPKASALTVQAMVAAYQNYARTRFTSNVAGNLGRTRKVALDTKRQLQGAQDQLRRVKEQSGILDSTSAQSNATTNLSSLQNELDAAIREQGTVTATDTVLQNLQDKANAAYSAYQAVTRDFFPDSDRARAAKSVLDAADAQVVARRTELESNARNRVESLRQSLERARAQASVLPAVEQQFSQLNARIADLQGASNNASARLTQLRLAGQNQPSVATVIHSTSVGSSQGTARIRSLAVSLASALALALLAAMLLDRLDRSVRTSPDPEVLFGAPVLGALPASKEGRTFYLAPTGANKGNARARTLTIEACSNAQHNILAAATASGARSILLTSALPKEGKSGCASNLAAAMAYGGREVLLIDVDFWHPSQHENFGLPLAPGYAQVLRDDLPLSEVIRPTPVANLFLLSTGQDAGQPGNIAELLDGRAHKRHMEMLQKYFDIIVLDAPPTMTVADAQLLSGLADTVVLVTAEKTPRDEVQRARSMLRLAGAHILGVVVNAVRPGEIGGWNLNFVGEEPFADYAQHRRTRGL